MRECASKVSVVTCECCFPPIEVCCVSFFFVELLVREIGTGRKLLTLRRLLCPGVKAWQKTAQWFELPI